MNQRFVSVLIFAFVVAAGASFLLYRLMASRVSQAKAETPVTRIVMAAHNLDAGALVKETDLKIGDWAGPVPAGAVLKKEAALGRGVIAAIFDGEPVLENRLAAKGGGAGLAAMIPKGMRAVAVRVNEVVGVAGFVVPGMRVDVLVSGNNVSTSGSVTKTLLQNIEVLSAGQEFKKDMEGKPISVPVVNLLVTPQQAEVLSLASSETHIQLVLRNPLDNEVAKTPGAALRNLFSDVAAPGPAQLGERGTQSASAGSVRRPAIARQPALPVPIQQAKPKEQFVVEMITGTKKVEARFTEESRPEETK